MKQDMVISVRDVTKRFGGFVAVDRVSFSVAPGEIVGFVGLNGAGKSTTINLLLGFIRSSHGTVELFGRPVSLGSAFRSHREIGFASGDMSLFTNLTGRQYMQFLRHQYGQVDDAWLNDLYQRFDPQLDKKIGELSRGNKQKIALIGAFMHRPELVILDEPSSGLDPLMQEAFLELVRTEGQRGTTIFMSSHYLNEVADVCSRVLLMRSGQLVKDIQAHQLAAISGKVVRMVSKQQVTPPKAAEAVTYEQVADASVLNFVYKGSMPRLQQWLTSVPSLLDFSVSEHDLETAFSDLYTEQAGEVTHV